MTKELFKSMIYRNNKVYTKQCSSNINPKHFRIKENKSLTFQYKKLGNQENFEKWFITFCIVPGNVEILSNSNKILRKLDYLANLLQSDNNFMDLRFQEVKIFAKLLHTKVKHERENISKEYIRAKEDIRNYISSFYDVHNPKYKDIERGR